MTTHKRVRSAGCWVLGLLVAGSPLIAQDGPARRPPSTQHPAPSTPNVILVIIDGVRWQEVFHGGDCALMNDQDGGVADTDRKSVV